MKIIDFKKSSSPNKIILDQLRLMIISAKSKIRIETINNKILFLNLSLNSDHNQ